MRASKGQGDVRKRLMDGARVYIFPLGIHVLSYLASALFLAPVSRPDASFFCPPSAPWCWVSAWSRLDSRSPTPRSCGWPGSRRRLTRPHHPGSAPTTTSFIHSSSSLARQPLNQSYTAYISPPSPPRTINPYTKTYTQT